jgi:hypothetical protein
MGNQTTYGGLLFTPKKQHKKQNAQRKVTAFTPAKASTFLFLWKNKHNNLKIIG